MLRLTRRFGFAATVVLAACSGSGYAVRPVPRIAADNVGKPVSVLQEAFGEPRKIETTLHQTDLSCGFCRKNPRKARRRDSRAAKWKSPSMHARSAFWAIRCRTSVGPPAAMCSGAFAWRKLS